jgi:hypothetical protein
MTVEMTETTTYLIVEIKKTMSGYPLFNGPLFCARDSGSLVFALMLEPQLLFINILQGG